jgi:hypothetical protein
MAFKLLGNVEIRDNNSQVTLSLDGENGNITLGGGGSDGDILMKNASGDITVGINGNSGAVHLGGEGQDGDLLLRNGSNNVTMHLNGSSGNIHLGGNGDDGDIFVKNSAGETTIHLNGSTGEINIKGWKLSVPDYVFSEDYQLREIDDLQEFIKKNHHLPDIPPSSEIEQNGVNLNQISMQMLKKIEELSLYIFDQQKTIKEQNKRLKRMEQTLGI